MPRDASVTSPVELVVECSERVNLAFQQNAIPVLRRLEIRNESTDTLRNLRCRITGHPPWCRPLDLRIDQLPAGGTFPLLDPPLELNLSFLAGLSERVRAELSVELLQEDDDGPAQSPSATGDVPDPADPGSTLGRADPIPIARQVVTVEVFAADEWTGLKSLPEILAAFVTPNTAAVDELLKQASSQLNTLSGDPALNGYQSRNRERVYHIVEAIFNTLGAQEITYSNPPASFESDGQRVRFADRILQGRLATCLDLSLLFAALMEQAGLRPLVFLQSGHAYAGCWLIEEGFAESAIDSLQTIRKRVELDEILLFETTTVCETENATFARAVAAAKKHLTKDSDFRFALDVFQCRAARILPLPIDRGELRLHEAASQKQQSRPEPQSRPVGPAYEMPVSESAEGSRIDHWKQQLLDLSLRNRLLNFRETNLTVPLSCPHPEQLEDEIAAEKRFEILEPTKLMLGQDPRSQSDSEQGGPTELLENHLLEELQSKRLRSTLPATELTKRLLQLYRRSRAEMEESGANTLFLALGFLEWRETPTADTSHRAPILLIPVKLERKSVQHGFGLLRLDEDAIINVTLLELLKRDFELEIPGVNPPPEDDSGVDVPKVFWIFRQAVKALAGWEVHEEVWLATFSFSKFLLWKDLSDRVEAMTSNRVVYHLVNNPGQRFEDGVASIDPNGLDSSVSASELYCPLSTDSSQLAAIVAASRGKNFVLRGPPGTGKSQTIANLITHSLAEGKRVLFVAEKRAALEVVHRRLERLGLAPFCLELHSNKSGKADVLKQFGAALEFGDQREPKDWSRTAEFLDASREALNTFVQELHQVHKNGLSAFQCYAWLIGNADNPEFPELKAPLQLPRIEEHSKIELDSLRELCELLRVAGSERRLSAEAKTALAPIQALEWTPDWEDQAVALSRRLHAQVMAARPHIEKLKEILGYYSIEAEKASIVACVDLGVALIGCPQLPASFVTGGEWKTFSAKVKKWIVAGLQRDSARKGLRAFDRAAVHRLDIKDLRRRYEEAIARGGILKSWRLRSIAKPIKALRLPGYPKLEYERLPWFFDNAAKLQEARRILNSAEASDTARLGAFWEDGEPDWDKIASLIEFGDRIHELIHQLALQDLESLQTMRSQVGDLLSKAHEVLVPGGSIAAKFDEARLSWDRLCESEKAFREHLLLGEFEKEETRGYFEDTANLASAVVEYRRDLQAWCRWQAAQAQARGAALDPLLEAVAAGDLDLDQARQAFERAYREAFLKKLITDSEVLRDFWGDEHERRIQRFQEIDQEYHRLAADTAIARLAAELPHARREDCPKNSELGILQRELAKRTRHRPVRRLLSDISAIAPKLKPCFLMSPLSVAQYLEVQPESFDLVVFDEASQITVWDAIGAIARGKQLVVVGDERQLPPTNFFERSQSEEDYLEDTAIADLESILDECRGAGLPVFNLRWHYRSRREGLIAFSNQLYYDGLLSTFPSPHSGHAGVRWIPVPNGIYEKGKSRTNPVEANAVAEAVAQHLLDPELSRYSLGVVTFSQAQQMLLLDKLDEARQKHPEIERFFDDALEEPVFVKNLENVQGDERDFIYFSIGYGPDRTGRVSMNFGPLNRAGGERRLNVAVTRARQENVVFSSLQAEHIDLTRTRALGALHLKTYLEYAARGPSSLGIRDPDTGHEDSAETDFPTAVAEFLRRSGYDVRLNIGCSGYRVDIAVVDPEDSGYFSVGIECDGRHYLAAANARDRDLLRRSVLSGLGWNLVRIWAIDWWRNRESAQRQLLEDVEREMKANRERRRHSPTEQKGRKSTPKESTAAESTVAGEKALVSERPQARAASSPALAETTESTSDAVSELFQEERESSGRAVPYPDVKFHTMKPQEQFFEKSGRQMVADQLLRIVEAEGPILESTLVRKAMSEWGLSRISQRIRKVFSLCFPTALAKTTQRDERVYWPSNIDPEAYHSYRVPHDDESSHRKLEQIPVEELRNAVLDAVERYVSLPEKDLIRQTGRKLGFNRLARKPAAILEEVLEELVAEGKLSLQEGNVRLPQ